MEPELDWLTGFIRGYRERMAELDRDSDLYRLSETTEAIFVAVLNRFGELEYRVAMLEAEARLRDHERQIVELEAEKDA